jgi:predicted metal-binding membrane protein
MAATPRRTPPLPGTIQAGLIALLLAIAAACWAVTDDRMGGMDGGPGTELGSLGWFYVVWVTMMAAMMLPSLAPIVLGHARLERGAGGDTAMATTVAFVVGYVLVWSAAGVVGYAVVEGVRSLDIGLLGWDDGGPYVAGAVIVAAGLYQLTALKGVCLSHCRSPRMLLEQWRRGLPGALRMGVGHGGYCVGSSGAMMAALFALGVMSLGWMAFVAALIAIEKLLPWRAVANRSIAVILVVLGLAVAFVPEDVPGLTIPGSSGSMGTMQMGMGERPAAGAP